MDHDLEALRAELAELRAELAEVRLQPATAQHAGVSRRRLLTGLAGLGAAGAAGVATSDPAAAATGDNLVVGQDNDATTTTGLAAGSPGPLPGSAGAKDPVLRVVGSDLGLYAAGAIEGIRVYGGAQGLVVESGGIVAFGAEATGDATGAVIRSEQGQALYLASDSGVQLFMLPTTSPGPPTSGSWVWDVGAVSLDADGDVWVCAVAPGVWTRLLREDTASGRTVPITPIRALDTRAGGGRPPGSPAVPGQKAGPLNGGTSITLDLAGIATVPATATGVIGNLTVVTPSYAGWLIARGSGAPATTSSLNFPKGVAALANAFTSQLGPAGITITGSGIATNTYHLIVDITAFVS